MKRTLSLICVLTFVGIAPGAFSAAADENDRRGNATVSFGQWDPNASNLLPAEVPLDRFLADPGMGRGNNHEQLPKVVEIGAGDSVSFIISGGHVLAIYDDGHQPEDINLTNIEQDNPATTMVNEACATTAGGILSDADRRIYRGPCFVGRRDGVEVVQFAKPGTYLVICARKDHFAIPNTVPQQFEMFGFVEVKKGKKGDERD